MKQIYKIIGFVFTLIITFYEIKGAVNRYNLRIKNKVDVARFQFID
ncbi:MAG: hypothetical protein Q7W45_06400 [Bacteroidota bacterium]|nr:hypothetical protein [Bacteroidota bacterium]